MSRRAPLLPDARLELGAAILALLVAAGIVLVALLLMGAVDADPTPTSTTYLVGPDGDAVEITP